MHHRIDSHTAALCKAAKEGGSGFGNRELHQGRDSYQQVGDLESRARSENDGNNAFKAQSLKGMLSSANTAKRLSRDEIRDTLKPSSVVLAEDSSNEEVLDLVRSQNMRQRQLTQRHDSKQSSTNKRKKNRASQLSSRTRNAAQHFKLQKSGSQQAFELKKHQKVLQGSHSRNPKLKLFDSQSRETPKPQAAPQLKRAPSGRNTIGFKKQSINELHRSKLMTKMQKTTRNSSLEEFPLEACPDQPLNYVNQSARKSLTKRGQIKQNQLVPLSHTLTQQINMEIAAHSNEKLASLGSNRWKHPSTGLHKSKTQMQLVHQQMFATPGQTTASGESKQRQLVRAARKEKILATSASMVVSQTMASSIASQNAYSNSEHKTNELLSSTSQTQRRQNQMVKLSPKTRKQNATSAQSNMMTFTTLAAQSQKKIALSQSLFSCQPSGSTTSRLRQVIGKCSPNASIAIQTLKEQNSKRIKNKGPSNTVTNKHSTQHQQMKTLPHTKQSSIVLSCSNTAINLKHDPAGILTAEEQPLLEQPEKEQNYLNSSKFLKVPQNLGHQQQQMRPSASINGINSERLAGTSCSSSQLKAERIASSNLPLSNNATYKLDKQSSQTAREHHVNLYSEIDQGYLSSCRLAEKERQPMVQMSSLEVDQPRDKSAFSSQRAASTDRFSRALASNCNPINFDQRESAGPASGLLGSIIKTARDAPKENDLLSFSLQRAGDSEDQSESFCLTSRREPASQVKYGNLRKDAKLEKSQTVRLPPRSTKAATASAGVVQSRCLNSKAIRSVALKPLVDQASMCSMATTRQVSQPNLILSFPNTNQGSFDEQHPRAGGHSNAADASLMHQAVAGGGNVSLTSSCYQLHANLNTSCNKISARNRQSLARPLVPKLNLAKMKSMRAAATEQNKNTDVTVQSSEQQQTQYAHQNKPNPVSRYSLDHPQNQTTLLPSAVGGATIAQTCVSIDTVRNQSKCYYQTTLITHPPPNHRLTQQSFTTQQPYYNMQPGQGQHHYVGSKGGCRLRLIGITQSIGVKTKTVESQGEHHHHGVASGIFSDQRINQNYLTQRNASSVSSSFKQQNASSLQKPLTLGQPTTMHMTQESESEIEVFNINNQISSTTNETDMELAQDSSHLQQASLSPRNQPQQYVAIQSYEKIEIAPENACEQLAIVLEDQTPLRNPQHVLTSASPAPYQEESKSKAQGIDQKTPIEASGEEEKRGEPLKPRSSLVCSGDLATGRKQAFKNGTFMYSCNGAMQTSAVCDSSEVLKQESLAGEVAAAAGMSLVSQTERDRLEVDQQSDEQFQSIQLPIFADLNDQIKECQAIETLFSPIQVEKTPLMGCSRDVLPASSIQADDNHFQTEHDVVLSPISRSADREEANAECSPDKIPQEDEIVSVVQEAAKTLDSFAVPFQESKNILNTRIGQDAKQVRLVRKPKTSGLKPRFLKSAALYQDKENSTGYKFSANSLKKRSPAKDQGRASCNPFSFFTPQAQKFLNRAQSPGQPNEGKKTAVVKAFPIFGGYRIGTESSTKKDKKVVNESQNPDHAAENPERLSRHERKRTAYFKQQSLDQKQSLYKAQQEDSQHSPEESKVSRKTLKDIMNHRSSSNHNSIVFQTAQKSSACSSEKKKVCDEDDAPFELTQTPVGPTIEDRVAAGKPYVSGGAQDDSSAFYSRTLRKKSGHKRVWSPLGALLNHRSTSRHSGQSAQHGVIPLQRKTTIIPSMKINLQNTTQHTRAHSPTVDLDQANHKNTSGRQSPQPYNEQQLTEKLRDMPKSVSEVIVSHTIEGDKQDELERVKDQIRKLELANKRLQSENFDLRSMLNYALQTKLNF